MLNYSANGPSGYNLTNSLRFRSSASARLSRTPTVAGNRKTWTYSLWIKRGLLGPTLQKIWECGNTSNDYLTILFNGTGSGSVDDRISLFSSVGGATALYVEGTPLYRDPSAWYHFVFAIDTTQATAANRVKIYVNGNQVTALSATTYPTQNSDLPVNNTVSHNIGPNPSFASQFFDGYMDEINFIDGQALTPSSFGSFNSITGVWQPARYTGTYGTNGFYLNFTDIALTSGSNTGLGKDFSGNGNYWNTNNISVTSGTTYDAMRDVPTLTSATVANYCVLNPLQKGSNITLSSANLTWSTSGASTKVLSTIGMSSGKYYCEFTLASGNGNYGVATARTGFPASNYLGDDTNSWCYAIDGNKYTNGSGAAYGATYTTGDIIGVAFDADNGTLAYFKNGVSQGTAFTGLTSGPYFFAQGADPSAGSVNFGQRPFTYTPPTGFLALNTFNLPTSTIVKGNTVMDATLYTGTGATQSITNAAGFRPDFVWTKGRSNSVDHGLMDSVRGTSSLLSSNLTAAQLSLTNQVTAFNSNGFSLGADNLGYSNFNGVTYVGWQWQAGQGTNTTNTAGSITSTVSVNTTAGFSIVTYTGTGANATVGHGLGVAPAMIIFKQRNAVRGWPVYHRSLGASTTIYLNVTNASNADSTIFNATSPTSSVFSLGASSDTNNGNVVAYCWAEISGFSAFGSYTGNGSSDGPFVYLGFRPKFVMVKKSSSTGSWAILDTARNPYNVTNTALYADLSNAENSIYEARDYLSNGFKLRTTDQNSNQSGQTFIYMAFAENPFKNALAR